MDKEYTILSELNTVRYSSCFCYCCVAIPFKKVVNYHLPPNGIPSRVNRFVIERAAS